MPHSELSFLVNSESVNSRLDVFLAAHLNTAHTGVSRTGVQRFIRDGLVSVNGAVCVSTHYRLKEGDALIVALPEVPGSEVLAEDIALEIVYRDDLVVINKPAGLVVHPAPGNAGHTLVNALLHHFPTLSSVNPQRPGIVHRLDKETSGLLLVARTNQAHLFLSRQFAEHTIHRLYCALVKGRTEYDEQIIEVPIGRHPIRREQMAVSYKDSARYAKTRYRTIMRFDDSSLLELEPFTGRTHQLRVHLAFCGHPILGDVKYGQNTTFPRMALHAKVLGFEHPRTHKHVEFDSKLPTEFSDYIAVRQGRA